MIESPQMAFNFSACLAERFRFWKQVALFLKSAISSFEKSPLSMETSALGASDWVGGMLRRRRWSEKRTTTDEVMVSRTVVKDEDDENMVVADNDFSKSGGVITLQLQKK